MHTDMEWWTRVRLEVSREGKKKREVLRDEGIGWETLKKILANPEPPGYRLKEPRIKPKIGAYLERIAQILEEDKALPKKQRHMAKRIYERIREMGYGENTQVKEAVREVLWGRSSCRWFIRWERRRWILGMRWRKFLGLI